MAIAPTVAAAAPAVTSVFNILVTEAMMVISAVAGWFSHSAFVTSTAAKIKAEFAKVNTSVTPAQ